MKLEVGMYVRTKRGKIGKIITIAKYNVAIEFNKMWQDIILKENIIKTSFNLIDLIKPKDIILGRDGRLYQCWKIYKDYVFTYSKNKQGQTVTLVDYQIDKVLTKEHFDKLAYKVGDCYNCRNEEKCKKK